jgi:putative flippase GtrA
MNLSAHIPILSKFFGVGVSATLLHGAVFSLLMAGNIASPQIANLSAYITAFVVSYMGQRYWTFPQGQTQGNARCVFRFLCVSILAYSLNALWVYITTDWLSISPYYALLGIGLLTPMMSFALMRLWVFSK